MIQTRMGLREGGGQETDGQENTLFGIKKKSWTGDLGDPD
jgi:hypothetical protein